jgi:CDP-diacylglycerol--glycerol-3-phosphate 3-phosphatidyltransferase
MTTATKITLLRVAMIPAFMVVLLMGYNWAALIIFAVASLTDFVDGYIARHYNQTSDFGKFLDPLADKLLVVAAMLIFVQWGRMPSWAVMVVLAREFAVSGLRMVAGTKGLVLAAGFSGKVKTFATMVGLCAMMPFSFGWLDWTVTGIIVATTLYSGIEYFVQNRNVFKS